MYKIIQNNKILGYVEKPWYIKKSNNGSYVACSPVEAQGVSFLGMAYPLLGHSEIPGVPVIASMVTDAEMISTMNLSTASVTMAKKQAKTLTDDDERLEVSVLYDDWAPGSYQVGDVYNTHQGGDLGQEWEQTWEVFQAYDNAVYPDIAPGQSAWYTFNRPLHGKTPETARPFVPVQGAHDMYRAGEYMIYTDGKIYHCKQDTAYSPTDYTAAWEVYGETTTTEPTPEPTPAEKGTKENPYDAEASMEYIYGKYYLDPDDSNIYLCKRTGEKEGGTIRLYYLPHELVGQYFEKV